MKNHIKTEDLISEKNEDIHVHPNTIFISYIFNFAVYYKFICLQTHKRNMTLIASNEIELEVIKKTAMIPHLL